MARLERIVKGEDGWNVGLVDRVPRIEESMARVNDAVERLEELERERAEREKRLIERQERAEAARNKWLYGIASALAITAIGQIFSFITDFLLVTGTPTP